MSNKRAVPVKRVAVEGFTFYLGSGGNSLGRFPKNLTELHDAMVEYADECKKHPMQWVISAAPTSNP